MNTNILLTLSFTSLFFLSCSSNSKDVKFQQYKNEGKRLYNLHCANCHQQDGSGLGKLIPPISSTFLKQNMPLVVCGIKNGIEGPLLVDSIVYNGNMTSNARLTPIEIAEIMTYISSKWANSDQIFSIDSVNHLLKNCTHR